jgi:GTP pyrophosphokinase
MNRFILKITPGDTAKLDFAYELAKYGHREQFRDSGVRYFEHLRKTAIILVDELGILDIDIIIAALLHDMFEDSFLLTLNRLIVTFGERVANFVAVLSKPKKGDPRFASDSERHQWYFAQFPAVSPEAKIIKLADRLHNMRTLSFCATEKQARKIEETRRIYFPLLASIAEKYPGPAQYLKDQLEQALRLLPH